MTDNSKKYIATYTDNKVVVETIPIEARGWHTAKNVAKFHKATRGLKGKISVKLVI